MWICKEGCHFNDTQPTKALIVTVDSPLTPSFEREERMEEMRRLADTAGLLVVGELTQTRHSPDPKYFLGRGKIGDLESLRAETGAEIVVFDAELTPVQIRNIEDIVGARLADRTQVILDIFAMRAATSEGKLQVELAQLLYALPRLRGRGVELSRLGGGIGTRGPGETKLETDRRVIRRRIARLQKEIDALKSRRGIQRLRRSTVPYPIIALVGYTNSGKSTLLNALTHSSILAEDRLFATLDPTVRRLHLPSGQTALLVDTVGFIRGLPHELVAAFRATLEEVVEAGVLVHVVDSSNPSYKAQMEVVSGLLESLGVETRPTVLAFNKSDVCRVPDSELEGYKPAVRISALSGEGLDSLLATIDRCLETDRLEFVFTLPYSKQSLLPVMYENGKVKLVRYGEESIVVTAELPGVCARRIREELRDDGACARGVET